MWIASSRSCFEVVQMATHHCDELCRVLERVDADERGVVPRGDVLDGTGADVGGPFEVPPELGLGAVAACGG